MLESINMLLEHNIACRQPLLDILGRMSKDDITAHLGKGIGSIREILVHIMNTEIHWISVLSGMDPDVLEPGDFGDITTISKVWRRIERETREFVEDQTEQTLQHVKSVQMEDELVSFTVGKALLHLLTHEIHHRGLLVGLIRYLGYSPPNVSMM
jgi:uncharacterized damage-inducible protein DinB